MRELTSTHNFLLKLKPKILQDYCNSYSHITSLLLSMNNSIYVLKCIHFTFQL